MPPRMSAPARQIREQPKPKKRLSYPALLLQPQPSGAVHHLYTRARERGPRRPRRRRLVQGSPLSTRAAVEGAVVGQHDKHARGLAVMCRTPPGPTSWGKHRLSRTVCARRRRKRRLSRDGGGYHSKTCCSCRRGQPTAGLRGLSEGPSLACGNRAPGRRACRSLRLCALRCGAS